MTPKSYLSSWWQSYKYRFVPWLSFNLPKRTARRVDRSTSDKVVPDAEVLRQVSAVTAALVQTLSEPVAQARCLRPQRLFLSALREIRNVFGEEEQAGGEYWRDDDEVEGDLNEGENIVDGSIRDEDSMGDVYWRCLVPPLPSPAAHRRALQVLDRVLGYRLQRCRSHVGGTGVRVYIAGNGPRRSLPRGRVVSLYPGTLYLPQQQPVLLQSLNNPYTVQAAW
ncbi:SET domain-containing protein 9 isoform X2 [Hyalella azteca]|uniref:SET domain-containing protein 9 isoform X2 n=1 Tax=Hyalella azteca TaxID=294128 RepID=A0A8B7NAF9_HYAAZ|nr:SET domain-containing protein 9 isoform X2 [Hyalella azteca]